MQERRIAVVVHHKVAGEPAAPRSSTEDMVIESMAVAEGCVKSVVDRATEVGMANATVDEEVVKPMAVGKGTEADTANRAVGTELVEPQHAHMPAPQAPSHNSAAGPEDTAVVHQVSTKGTALVQSVY